MTAESVDNAHFAAQFPESVTVTEEAAADGTRTTEFASDVEPFGTYTVRVTTMTIDAFLPVGASAWTKVFGDNLLRGFATLRPELLVDTPEVQVGGAMRKLVANMDYNGPCRLYAFVFAVPDGTTGRVIVASAIVDADDSSKDAAKRFLESVQVKWSPAV